MDSPEDSPDRVERVWNTPPYQCPHCDKPAFGSYNAMVMHFRDSVHILRCNECGDHWFPSISHVLIHYFEEHRRFYNRRIGPRDGRKAKEHLPKRAPRSKRAPKGKRAPVKAQDERPCKYTDPDGIKPVQITERDLPIVTYLMSEACHSQTRLEKHDFTLESNVKSGKKKESKGFLNVKDFTTLPEVTKHRVAKRNAIVIDCEMVEGANGCREVAYLSAIDFFSGNCIIDTFIEPRTKVVNWNTRYSGVSEESMRHAMRIGTTMTWESMRGTLEMVCDKDTILIGHALNNDLDVLGLLPSKVLDSSIHTSEAVFFNYDENKRLPRIWSLKKLAKELLNHDIQTSKEGHSSLEDAYATREVVFWALMNPGDLRLWGIEKKKIEDEVKAKRDAKNEEERRKRMLKDQEAERVAEDNPQIRSPSS